VCESRGAAALHRGAEALRAFFTVVFSNGGGVDLEHCTATIRLYDDVEHPFTRN
jgi:hypothetical protein